MTRDLVRAGSLLLLAFFCCAICWSLLALAAGLRVDVVLSGSMGPSIRTGDVVISLPVDSGDLRPGTIISFTDPADPRRTLVHRVIARDADGSVRTQGDANAEPDSTAVPAGLVNGRGLVRIPYVGLPAFWARTGQYGLFTLFAVALVLLAAGATVSSRHAKHRVAGRHRMLRPRHQASPAARALVRWVMP